MIIKFCSKLDTPWGLKSYLCKRIQFSRFRNPYVLLSSSSIEWIIRDKHRIQYAAAHATVANYGHWTCAKTIDVIELSMKIKKI